MTGELYKASTRQPSWWSGGNELQQLIVYNQIRSLAHRDQTAVRVTVRVAVTVTSTVRVRVSVTSTVTVKVTMKVMVTVAMTAAVTAHYKPTSSPLEL